MSSQVSYEANRRLLILAEGVFSPLLSKTANGAILYLNEQVIAVIDSTKAGRTVQEILGYGGTIPIVRNLQEGLQYAPTHLLIGVGHFGGRLPDEWMVTLREALEQKLNLLSGLHTILSDNPELKLKANHCGVTITDYRKIPQGSEVVARGTWKTRRAKVILTVGTDCNIGKMTTILEIYKEFRRRGLKSDFVATGQTGILIRGRGIAVDSIISDYIAGSIEREIDQSESEGFDYIFVEGQGALTHIGYSGVTLGLMHGVMPDAMILCHQPARLTNGYGFPIPDLNHLIILHEQLVNIFRKTKIVCIGINSIRLSSNESLEVSTIIEKETGLPTIDALKFGAARLVDALLEYFQRSKADSESYHN
jgi:uncharacterized NAD-dependent epimerase/dehydratase family protein